MKLYFTINALSHCDWKDCTAQLVEEVQDKHVLLVAEENNVDFPKSTPLNVNKKKKSASKQEKSEHKHE